jgi:hypothetical protein
VKLDAARELTPEAVAAVLTADGERPADRGESGWKTAPARDGVLVYYKQAGPGEAPLRREALARWTTALEAAGWTVSGRGASNRTLLLQVTARPRDKAIALLLAAGFTQHAPRRRRKRDPAPADGFRVFENLDSDWAPTGTITVAWVPVGGGDHKNPAQHAKSLQMAEAYAAAAPAGWTTAIEGVIWRHAQLTPPAGEG